MYSTEKFNYNHSFSLQEFILRGELSSPEAFKDRQINPCRDHTERFPAGKLSSSILGWTHFLSERSSVSSQTWLRSLAGTCALGVLLLFIPHIVALFLKGSAYHQINYIYYEIMKLHSLLFIKSEPIRASSSYKKARTPFSTYVVTSSKNNT